MRLIAQNNFFNVKTQAQTPANYYLEVAALTSKSAPQKSGTTAIIEDSVLSLLFSPFLIYGTIGLFFAIFCCGIIYQIITKTIDMKKTISTLVVALVVASIPFTLKTALEVTSLSSRAGPDEIPRNLQIQPVTSRSVIVTWETDAEKVGAVRVGKASTLTKNSKVYIGDLGKQVKKHTVRIEELETRTIYEIEILSGSTWYDNSGTPIQFKMGDL